MSKKQKKSGASKKRKKRYAGPRDQRPNGDELPEPSGAMQGIVGGFRRAVGVETKKKKGVFDYVWTGLLLVAIVLVVWFRWLS